MASLFMSIKHVMQLTEVSATSAQRKLAKIRAAFCIPKYQPVTVTEYCKFNRLEVDFVMRILEFGIKKPF